MPKIRHYYINRGTQKIAAELAAIAKNIFISNHRTSEALKHKSAATLSTFAATFCIIIIEAQIFETLKPQKAYRNPTDLLWCSRNLQVIFGKNIICHKNICLYHKKVLPLQRKCPTYRANAKRKCPARRATYQHKSPNIRAKISRIWKVYSKNMTV